jgi:ribosomal protein S3
LDFQSSERFELIKNNWNDKNRLFLDCSYVKYSFADIFFNKAFRFLSKFNKGKLLLLSPKIITSYITNQLNKSSKLKRASFRKNFSSGISIFSYQLLRHLQHNLTGFKIMCSGKWKKTRSGRKQRLTIKFGRVRGSSLSNKILYHYSYQETRYGSCGIKVWVAHKK